MPLILFLVIYGPVYIYMYLVFVLLTFHSLRLFSIFYGGLHLSLSLQIFWFSSFHLLLVFLCRYFSKICISILLFTLNKITQWKEGKEFFSCINVFCKVLWTRNLEVEELYSHHIQIERHFPPTKLYYYYFSYNSTYRIVAQVQVSHPVSWLFDATQDNDRPPFNRILER